MKKWIFLLLMMCVISACQHQPVQSASPTRLTSTSTYHTTQTIEASATKRNATLTPFTLPTLTPELILPSSSPLLPLQTNGPYLVYFKQVGENRSLVELDADGIGRKEIILSLGLSKYDLNPGQLSEDGNHLLFSVVAPIENKKSGDSANFAYRWYLITLSTAEIRFLNDDVVMNYFSPSFSPDGKWLIFYTPVFPPSDATSPSCSCSLTLNLTRLADGKTIKHINLLPPDYPQNFERLLQVVDPKFFLSTAVLEKSFLQGIDSVSWSPNGRYMAFSGGMDGPSSDLYVYDLETQAIQRLSDGWENIQWIDWSSDGKRIFHASSYYDVCEGNCSSYYVATLDGKPPVKMLSDQTDNRIFSNWLTASRELLYTNDNGVGQAYLRYLDHDTNRTVDIYPYSFNSFALDSVSKMLIVISLDESVSGTPLGIHLVNPWDSSRQTIDAGVCNPPRNNPFYAVANSLSSDKYRFVIKCWDGTALVALDGSVKKLSEHALDVIEVPKRGWLLAFDNEGQKAILFSSNLDVMRHIKVHSPQLMRSSRDAAIWLRADGDGVFYLSDDHLYYWALDSDSEKLVDDAVVEVKQWITH